MAGSRSSHPLREWSLRNFKSVRSADIELGPLTVLIGPNSSGKTSLIQSIMLFVQASRSWRGGASLRFNGPYVSLGEFDDVHSIFATDEKIEFGGRFFFGDLDETQKPPPQRREMPVGGDITWRVSVTRDDGSTGSGDFDSLDLTHESGLALHADRLRTPSHPLSEGPALSGGFVPVRASIRDQHGEDVFGGLEIKSGLPTGYAVERPFAVVQAEGWIQGVLWSMEKEARDGGARSGQVSLLDMVPMGLRSRSMSLGSQVDVEGVYEDGEGNLLDGLSLEDLAPILNVPSEFLATITDEYERAVHPTERTSPHAEQSRPDSFLSSDDRERFIGLVEDARSLDMLVGFLAATSPITGMTWQPLRFGRALNPVRNMSNELTSYFQQGVSYLGPLREAPQAMYGLSYEQESDEIGQRGEHTASVLFRHGQGRIQAPVPDGGVRRMTLESATNVWLKEFGLADSIDIGELSRLGLAMRVNVADLDRAVDITSVGVGLSQILPVLVRVLLADHGSLVLLEQPELHLHPALQQKLGEFLLRSAESGRQIIVETHSDHLVSRLRLLVARDTDNRIGELIQLVNVWREDGETVYRPVDVNTYGGIDEWPPGFFDQAASEARSILQAGLDKRRREAEQSMPRD